MLKSNRLKLNSPKSLSFYVSFHVLESKDWLIVVDQFALSLQGLYGVAMVTESFLLSSYPVISLTEDQHIFGATSISYQLQ